MRTYSINDCNLQAGIKKGRCLSVEYSGCNDLLEWECEMGHRWFAPFRRIVQNHWCPQCQKGSLVECRLFADTKNGKCISDNYLNCDAAIEWECQNKHVWFASFYHVKNGSWCPYCSHKAKHTIEECNSFAISVGGKCLSVQYINNKSPLEWECEEGHRWKACFDSIRNCNSWCPVCKNIGRKQKQLFKVVCEIFPNCIVYYNYRGFDWLKTQNTGKQEIDIYVVELKLAIEFDGQQHFSSQRFGGISLEQADINFYNTVRLDAIKNDKIRQHPEDIKWFVRFNYTEKIVLGEVKKKLSASGLVRETE